MKKTDQEDYLKLHNNFDHIQSLPSQKYLLLKTELEMRRTGIFQNLSFLNSIEANKEKAEEMVKIFNIYGSNAFLNGVYLKVRIFWEGPKNLAHLQLKIDATN